MRILIYKRTHVGDPDRHGRFGIYDCMGRVRDYTYDAVIGVGGIGQEPKSFGIDRRNNWVGINPAKKHTPDACGVEVTFKTFRLFDEQGPLLEDLAPSLATRMYHDGARILIVEDGDPEYREATKILRWSVNQ